MKQKTHIPIDEAGNYGTPEVIWVEEIRDVDDYNRGQERMPGKELQERIIADPERWRQNVLAAMADQRKRKENKNERDKLQKWQKNQTLKKWWLSQYGEQNYFSIQDAIKESFVKF